MHAPSHETKEDEEKRNRNMAQNRTNKLYRQNVIRIIAFRKENKKMYSRVILIIFVFQIERFRVDALSRIHMQCGRWVFQNETFSHTTVSDVIERLKNREKRRTQDPLCINMFCFCLSNWFDILLCVCVCDSIVVMQSMLDCFALPRM